MQLRLGLTLVLSAFTLVGCNSLAIKNGSLDYQETTTLKPLKYPEGALVRPATPLYPAPQVDQLAIINAPKYENEKGNRFALPRPYDEQPSVPQVQVRQGNVPTSNQVTRPQPFIDGNQNPLLKIDGNSATIWQYTLATISSLNYTVVAQSKDRQEVTISIDQQNFVLKLTSSGSSNNLALYTPANQFADKSIAANLLSQIYQNWPA
jgi:uncharacterized lipoprotein